MNKTVEESTILIKDLLPELRGLESVRSIICPPFTSLAKAAELVKGSPIQIGAQDLYWQDQGAFTGEISPVMVSELAEFVILGHSERRAYFHDTDETINQKILAAIRAELKPIFCVGETLEENEAGRTGEVVARQVRGGLNGVDLEQMDQIMIAYEPVWAIGTGKAATAEGANQIIKKYIRAILSELFPGDTGERVPILYGGSVKPENAREYFQQPDIDGALVGGASLNAEDFIAITKAAV